MTNKDTSAENLTELEQTKVNSEKESIGGGDGATVKRSAVGAFFNRFFHFYERGSTMKSEIGAGLGAFFVAVCALLMNTQIIGQAYGSYAGAYLAVTIISFVGTLVIGLVCNLPLMQTANMATSTVIISMLGVNTGLTYANLMLITFIAAIIYLVIVVSPVKKYIMDALPAGVRKALPVAVGLFVMYTALRNAGIISAGGTLTSSSSFLLPLDKFYFWLLLLGVAVFLLFKGFKRKKPMFATLGILLGCMWIGSIAFFMDSFIGGETATEFVYKRLNLFISTDGAQPYNIAHAFESLNFGALFSEGFDFTAFSAEGGNVLMVFLQGILTFLALGLYSNAGNARAVASLGGLTDEKGRVLNEEKMHIVSASLCVAAPLFGASPPSIGTQSGVAVSDGAKTGLSSVVTSAGFLVAAFTWIFFAFFATGVNGVGMWIEDTEIKLAAYVQDTFIFADFIMVLVGASMLKNIKHCNFSDIAEIGPFAAVVAGTVFAGNIAFGVALGAVVFALIKLIGRKFNEFTVPVIVSSAIMLLYTVVALL